MSFDRSAWRLLVHSASDGAWNMAVDEAILESYLAQDANSRPPTLRLYGWNPPALSLGKSQPSSGSFEPPELRRRGIDLVRRPTGGLAVLHDRERTYSVVGALRREPFAGGVLETYRSISAALEDAMRTLGAPARASSSALESKKQPPGPSCFALTSTHEITVEGRKLIGSAQLRRGRAFLQHGSIPINTNREALAALLGDPVDGESYTDLSAALGRAVRSHDLDRAIKDAFARQFGVELQADELTADEQVRAAQIRCWKYLSVDWTLNGRVGQREQRWGADRRR